ncbi:glycosyltransferase family 61 protein [Maritimibacter alkaliphilus]|nr:glycosyltransferase 61 family protein [Maritimibacter alkaliphilus]MBY6092918.1 glycosyltransferase family 61 protein [Maritimibacter alkaliphilus]
MNWLKTLRTGNAPVTGAGTSGSSGTSDTAGAAAEAGPAFRPGPGLFPYYHRGLPEMTCFREIPVVPVTEAVNMVMRGGPAWPDWRGAAALRHNRSGQPVDRFPPALPDQQVPFDTPATWGGHCVAHFGHFIAEHGTRILQSRVAHGDKPMLFTLEPGRTAEDVPGFFWQILAWYGVSARQVRFVHQPLRVSELWAAPMAEQWAHVPTAEGYLDLLDANTAARGLRPRTRDVVYVTRAAMEATAEGHGAGEPYLNRALEQLGVTVIRPEAMPLEEQLAHYQGAKLLIFAEGSAMHGRQLLGRADQTVVVLNRRPGMRIGLAALQPRVSRMLYAEATRGTASVLWPNGNPWIVRAISIYDTEVLLGVFEALGIPLSQVWDEAAYLAARDTAIRTWIRIRFDPAQPIDHAASRRRVAEEFRALGLDHLVAELPQEG